MYQERKNYAYNFVYKPKYIPEPIWNQLIHYWASDKKFKNLSVANIANIASTQGSSIHTDGSISMGEYERRMVRHLKFLYLTALIREQHIGYFLIKVMEKM
jgi:hypothetical protein